MPLSVPHAHPGATGIVSGCPAHCPAPPATLCTLLPQACISGLAALEARLLQQLEQAETTAAEAATAGALARQHGDWQATASHHAAAGAAQQEAAWLAACTPVLQGVQSMSRHPTSCASGVSGERLVLQEIQHFLAASPSPSDPLDTLWYERLRGLTVAINALGSRCDRLCQLVTLVTVPALVVADLHCPDPQLHSQAAADREQQQAEARACAYLSERAGGASTQAAAAPEPQLLRPRQDPPPRHSEAAVGGCYALKEQKLVVLPRYAKLVSSLANDPDCPVAFSEADKQLTRELAALGRQVGQSSETALEQLECSVDDNVARMVHISKQVGWGLTASWLALKQVRACVQL